MFISFSVSNFVTFTSVSSSSFSDCISVQQISIRQVVVSSKISIVRIPELCGLAPIRLINAAEAFEIPSHGIQQSTKLHTPYFHDNWIYHCLVALQFIRIFHAKVEFLLTNRIFLFNVTVSTLPSTPACCGSVTGFNTVETLAFLLKYTSSTTSITMSH